MQLSDYLDTVAARDCAYGRLDCATLMADWLVARGIDDPMPDCRGTYANERQYRAAIRREGGIVESCRRRFSRVGLRATATPRAGDVALVLAPFGVRSGRPLCRPTGAIMLTSRVAAVLDWPRGVVGAALPVIAAWSLADA
jgi:hypothetical protein